MTRILAATLFASLLLGLLASVPAEESAKKEKLYELRIYTTHDGKLDDLHARFRNHTNKLFRKHGMELVAYWTPTEPGGKIDLSADNSLVYVLAYPDKAAREKAWKGFLADPQWKQAFAESRKDGPIVKKVQNCFMSATDYSPLK